MHVHKEFAPLGPESVAIFGGTVGDVDEQVEQGLAVLFSVGKFPDFGDVCRIAADSCFINFVRDAGSFLVSSDVFGHGVDVARGPVGFFDEGNRGTVFGSDNANAPGGCGIG